ncbi:RnfABCDGE type electron transport complex subunit G [Hathewaya massiliensis]|uniref:RnfABCDGE type electron transport complex subunit G n=1 Tax=Hathewaya massiliensis TaxID=1964382 RepID=UPI001157A214|nr:RnfABCDGE type electron transport complex subunit G [Hathewaya massiliensis]
MDKKSDSLKLGGLLLIITACAGLILGFAYSITKDPIAKQTEKENNEAMKEILTKAETFKKKEDAKLPENILELNEAKLGNDTIGYAIKIQTKGYGGKIDLMVGISKDGKVEGIKILNQSETPGLGANSTNPNFYNQYKEKSIDKDIEVIKTTPSKDNEIQAITGATITSRAVTSAVNEAVKYYKSELEGGSK